MFKVLESHSIILFHVINDWMANDFYLVFFWITFLFYFNYLLTKD